MLTRGISTPLAEIKWTPGIIIAHMQGKLQTSRYDRPNARTVERATQSHTVPAQPMRENRGAPARMLPLRATTVPKRPNARVEINGRNDNEMSTAINYHPRRPWTGDGAVARMRFSAWRGNPIIQVKCPARSQSSRPHPDSGRSVQGRKNNPKKPQPTVPCERDRNVSQFYCPGYKSCPCSGGEIGWVVDSVANARL